jgi:hypothetical protein
MTRHLAAAILFMGAAVVGCRGPEKGPTGAGERAAPDYAGVAAAYNGRLRAVDRLWARSVIRVWYPDKEGQEQTEQVEGHFQFVPPNRLLLTFNKLGETYAALGSNATRYWWIDLTDEHRMYVGLHEKVTPDRIAELGLPVHPLELVEAAGFAPLPEDASRVKLSWSADGTALVASVSAAPGGVVRRRVYLEPAGYLVMGVELLDETGAVVVTSRLSRPERVRVRFPEVGPELPMTFEVTAGRVRVKLELNDADTTRRDPRDRLFDVDWLRETYAIRRVIDLDAGPG